MNNLMNLVSVIIPCYNRENTIVDSINSVLNQSYQNIEVIVVDDASIDNSVDKILLIKDERVKLIKLDVNCGACHARNVGIDNANGEFIAFQDSDDVWNREKLSVQMSKLQDSGSSIVFCQFTKINTNKTNIFTYPIRSEGFLSRKELLLYPIVSTQCLLCKKSVFDTNRFDEKMPRLQDYDLVIRLSENYRFYFIEQSLVDVYEQENSISRENDKYFIASKRILSKYPDLWLKYPNIAANIYNLMGNYAGRTTMEAIKYYKLAMNTHRGVKELYKYYSNLLRMKINEVKKNKSL